MKNVAKPTDPNEWLAAAGRVVLDSQYGINATRIIRILSHKSKHIHFLDDQGNPWILSAIATEPGRIPFSLQFHLLECLQHSGWTYGHLPKRNTDGSYFCTASGLNWVLKKFVDQQVSDKNSPGAISSAGQILADMHRAGTGCSPLSPDVETGLTTFYWDSIRWASEISTIWDTIFDRSCLASDEVYYLEKKVHEVASLLPYINEFVCKEILFPTVTHQDYRPANFCFVKSQITQIWDWDIARPDASFYDVAFASLQYGGRECLFSDISLERADYFIKEYSQRIGVKWCSEKADIMNWFMMVCILKRTLMNWHARDRVQLLRKIDEYKSQYF
ncbi:hypothetical protein [Agrobacterium tumefaciens]|uniref:hypothetical protein n=1 Tax=Agrobacterium tumefaciens TaxID=358 RepID=UPI0012B917A7|nr:hypothetical protein [Agrobacterium tumefaciens]